MTQQPDRLNIQSPRNERRSAVNDCVARLVAEGRTRDQARAICSNAADRRMGTRAPRPGV